MCVEKEINKVLNYPENGLLLGSISLDISKHLGKTKIRSRFFNSDGTIDIDKFFNNL